MDTSALFANKMDAQPNQADQEQTTTAEKDNLSSNPATNPAKRKLDEPKGQENSFEERVASHYKYYSEHLSVLNNQLKLLDNELLCKKEQLKQTLMQLLGPEMSKTQIEQELASFKENMDKINEDLSHATAEIEELKGKVFEEKKKSMESQTLKGQKALEILSQYTSSVRNVSREVSDAFEFKSQLAK